MVRQFRELTPDEAADFRQYAREHDPDPNKWRLYHPVCRDEWTRLGKDPCCYNCADGYGSDYPCNGQCACHAVAD